MLNNHDQSKKYFQILIYLYDKKIWYIVVNALLFLTPMLIRHEQIIVGVLVNLYLIILGRHYSTKQFIPSIFLPSIAVIAVNTLFGTMTSAVAVMMPVIWFGNLVFTLMIRKFEKYNASVLFAAVAKFLVIAIPAVIIINLLNLPAMLTPVFTWMQLLTALLSGIIYLISSKSIRSLTKIRQQ